MNWFAQSRPWLLLGSLTANLFFAALVIAAVAFGPMGERGHPPPVRHILRAAGPEAKPLIDKALATREAEMRVAGDALKAARQELKDAMTADTVDPARLRQALDGQRAARGRLLSSMEDVLVDVLPQLDLETRKKLSERRKRRRGGDRDDRDDKKSE